MVSVCADSDDVMFLYKSVIRGHHIYKSIWSPRAAEVLSVVVDPANQHNHFVVAIFRTDVIVDHVPREVSRIF